MVAATLARNPAVIAWAPQPGPQAAFIACPIFEVVYGGARGGGKTDATLGDWIFHQARYKEHAKGLFVRRKQVDLASTIERARGLFTAYGAKFNEQKSMFRFPNGSAIWFRYLERDADADNYQGHDYTRVYCEELTQFPSDGPVNKLKATLRSAAGVPCGFRASCNPGGPGHTWVKARYIDPGAWKVIKERFKSPFDNTELELDRVFIPARLTDNQALMASDPLYIAKLQQSGSAQLVKAWLEGDWNIIEGAFFDKWSSQNIVKPFEVPKDWARFRSFDWGSARPFSVGWWAVAGDDLHRPEGVIPRGALVRYREWYGSTGKPNEGLKLSAESVAAGILEREKGDANLANSVADPAIFAEDGGPSIGERMRRAGVAFRKADNARVGRAGAMGGWDQMRSRIEGRDGRPLLYVFDTCRDFIRTVPVLQHDPMRPEDLDTDGEDHAADECRYACMARQLAKATPKPSTNPTDLGRWRRQTQEPNAWKVT